MAKSSSSPQWHVLDFSYDDEAGEATLTVYVNGVRFHIIADDAQLGHDTEIGDEYQCLLRDYRLSHSRETNEEQNDKNEVDVDSGVDVNDTPNEQRDAEEEEEFVAYDDEEALQTWMVMPLVETFEELAPSLESSQRPTLQEWYHGQTQFCDLTVSYDGKELQAIKLEETATLRQRIDKLLPQATLPKYLTEKLDAQFYDAGDLTVIDASDEPVSTPYHPCRVQHRQTKEIYFLKVVDNSQPQATKREIGILQRLKDLKLHEQMRVPILEGLVTFDDAEQTPAGKDRILGFLQTDIPNPTPLTTMLRTDVSQKKRDAWATEAKKLKDNLHNHKIVWGDAKADNFIVDSDENLWIIDFGGGYTEGWVDRELNETEEGDDTATEKIVNALKDPTVNIVGDDSKDSTQEAGEDSNRNKGKRRRENDDESTEDNDVRPSKSRR